MWMTMMRINTNKVSKFVSPIYKWVKRIVISEAWLGTYRFYSLWSYRKHSYKATKYLWNYFSTLSLYVAGSHCFFTQTSKNEFSLPLGWTYPAGIPAGEQGEVSDPKAACKLERPVCPVSSNIWYPSAGQGASQSITTIRALPSLEYINYASIQTIPPAIPSWRSYLRTIPTTGFYLRTN